MGLPYSKQKWMALTLAAVVMATGSSVWAADSTAALSVAPAKQSDQSEELTLQKAVEQALKTNNDLVTLHIDIDTADINARLASAKGRDLRADFVTTLDAAQAKYVNTATAETKKKVNEMMFKSAENKVKLGAEKAYYDLLNAQEDLTLKKQSQERAELQLKVAKSAFDVGTKAKTDVLQAEAALAAAQAATSAAESNLEVARLNLNQFLGVELNKQWKLVKTDAQANVKMPELNDAVAKALEQRPEITQATEQIKLSELNVDIIRKYSSIATYQGQMAENDVEKAKIDLEQTKRSISIEVAQAYYNLNSAKTSIEALKKARDAAAENYRLTNLRFENGLSTTLEVIGAEEELSNRENQYQQAVHNFNLATVTLQNAIGN
ncbi:TolC family protein [Brevibacillus sp. B_LB10_24]|uniref:TolC family protein n=1 Tax=Brevibacillus sp. B_LB10_24 TaxID=3380645 RepID=UPI0038B96087